MFSIRLSGCNHSQPAGAITSAEPLRISGRRKARQCPPGSQHEDVPCRVLGSGGQHSQMNERGPGERETLAALNLPENCVPRCLETYGYDFLLVQCG